MIDDTMNSRDLVQKTADSDVPREMIGFAVEHLMPLDVGTKTDTVCGVRSADRSAQRSG